ncbi:MAG: carbon-nitrogen hydrolase family protein [Gammaproteobacteria bacterium]|nr:carbon-nitrogen hydrolase family protein [Gammaproteobacteria bacterium]MCP5410403.1 carbon-nitrogen hydrolase family protein [Chromatiaceae bacterium]MCP5444708.1 carbon-nitrogen hydrolase family protein [Chromatiaceae bacterium]
MSENQKLVAAVQMASSPNVSANLLKADQLVAEAVAGGAGLVVLPENFSFMGEHEKDLLALRESDGEGPLQEYLSQTAKRHGIWLVGGTIPLEAQSDSKVRAACLVYNDEGERVARYDKIHLFDVNLVEARERYAESGIIEPGGETVVVDTPFGKLGIAVCYDLRFPELFRKLLDKGMEVACLPAAFTAITGKAHWETLVRARAIENLSYVVAAAQGGFHINGRETHGHSMIVDPWGTILAQAPRVTGSICCALDLDYLATTRRNFPTIEHRKIR